eukprot:TRINITY_DN12103_c0_g2_i21.p1 TRINITY_DN12103_c0_g2~~TRINITY_DN12103_c0_g2_i21.p1  ORF type:complete len:257 (-),score=71.18 TRINITY_DN12103_c0_g2_i21:131-901(-)
MCIRDRYVVYQVLCCLKELHGNGLMHRDLKPSNVLVTPECLVKVTDFGSMRSIEAGGNFTRDVGTLWYSAPEVLLGSKSYGTAVDMWALGCILAEMMCKKPIFCSGTTMEQIAMILALVEWPSEEDMKELKCPLSYHSLNYLPKMDPVSFEELCPSASEEALDLLEKLLVLVPSRRLTADEALDHPFVSEFGREESKKEMNKEANVELDISDSTLRSASEYKDRIYYYIESHKNLEVKEDKGSNPILEKLKYLKYN